MTFLKSILFVALLSCSVLEKNEKIAATENYLVYLREFHLRKCDIRFFGGPKVNAISVEIFRVINKQKFSSNCNSLI
jgi:hypothetical protein